MLSQQTMDSINKLAKPATRGRFLKYLICLASNQWTRQLPIRLSQQPVNSANNSNKYYSLPVDISSNLKTKISYLQILTHAICYQCSGRQCWESEAIFVKIRVSGSLSLLFDYGFGSGSDDINFFQIRF